MRNFGKMYEEFRGLMRNLRELMGKLGRPMREFN